MTLPSQDDTNWNALLKAHALAGHNEDGTHKLTEITAYKILTLTRVMTANDGDVTYTGAGFTPRQVMFLGEVPSTEVASWGNDDDATPMCTYQDFDGDIDESAYYLGRILTLSEISWLNNSGAGRAYSELGGDDITTFKRGIMRTIARTINRTSRG